MAGRIFKRSKSSWTIQVDMGRDRITGKRKQILRSIKGTRQDAERELRAINTARDTGSYIKPTKLTLGQYLESWLQDYVTTNTAASTADGYNDIIRAHLIPQLGAIPLVALEATHIQAYYARLLQSGRRDDKGGLSAKTVKNHHRVLSKALRQAVEYGLLIRNVAKNVAPPRYEPPEMAALGPEDVDRLLEASRQTPFYNLFYTAVYTGLRRSELLGLRWKDVDLDFAVLSIVRTLQHIPKVGYVEKKPKTPRSQRAVDLTPQLALLLREHRSQQEVIREFLGVALAPNDLVFSNPDGTPLAPNSVTKAFRKLANSLGFTSLRLHDLRHSHATILLRQGVHPKIVSDRLGHNSVNITLDTYSHVLPGLQAAAALRFDEAMEEARQKSNGCADVINCVIKQERRRPDSNR